MRYMLDTNMIIKAMKGMPETVLIKYKNNLNNMCISSISYSELVYGISKSNKKHQLQNMVSLSNILTPMTILSYDDGCSMCYGELRYDLEKRGCLIGSLDMLIAAHAKTLGLTLVTNNTKEFERVNGLLIEDWSD